MAYHKIAVLRNRHPLPDPYASGFAKDRLLNGRAGFLSLLGKSGFAARWAGAAADPLEYLLTLQKDLDRPIFLIPHLIFFNKRPRKPQQGLTDILFGPKQRPGRLRRLLTLFSKPEDIFVEISEPIDLKLFLKNSVQKNLSTEESAAGLRRRLLNQINGHRQRITGPALKSGEELRQTVLTSPDLNRYIRRYAARRNINIAKARKEAAKYFDEIAAKYNPGVVAFGAAMMRRFLRTLFDDIIVDLDGLNRVKRKPLRGPLVFIPCHKSNFDNLTLMSVLHANHLHCPHTFAGENLSFWPVGPFIRRTGAFFMRRSFKGAVFYAMVFSQYIKTLLKEGHNLEVFIEGTRSRSGKLLPPQTGGLSILIGACQNGACPDLVFVPVSIGYDRIPEEGSYLHEIQGGQKTKEGLWMMIKSLKCGKIFKSRYGRIYFRFAEPIALSSFMEKENQPMSERLKGKKLNQFSYKVGQQLLFEVQRASIITPQALTAAALLISSRQNITVSQTIEIVDTYLAYLSYRDVFMTDTLSINPAGSVTQAINYYARRNIIEPIDTKGSDDQFTIIAAKRHHLEFNKNNAIGHLVPAAFTAVTILAIEMFQFNANHLQPGYAFLRELFANEFCFDPEQSDEYLIRKTLKIFIDDAILVPHPTLPDTYNLTSPGFRKLQFFSGLLTPLFEAYAVALSYYDNLPEKFPSKKERIKNIRSLAQYILKKKQIDRAESISEAYFDQADAFFIHLGFQKPDSAEKRKNYSQRINYYLSHLK